MSNSKRVSIRVGNQAYDCQLILIDGDKRHFSDSIKAGETYAIAQHSDRSERLNTTIDLLRQIEWRDYMADTLQAYVDEQQRACGRSEKSICESLVSRALSNAPHELTNVAEKTLTHSNFRRFLDRPKRPNEPRLVLIHLFLLNVAADYKSKWIGDFNRNHSEFSEAS